MFKIINKDSYKIGVDEIEGMKEAMRDVLQVFVKALPKEIAEIGHFDEAEYKSRPGFIPNSNNKGSIEWYAIVPKCYEYSAPKLLEFGECDGSQDCDNDCICYNDGLLDAKLRVWLKYEGGNAFYLVMSGGNGDAPYFREKDQPVLFEKEFTANSLEELKTKGKEAVREMIKEFY